MAADMKEQIAQAAGRLLFEKKVKRLTVKDIVEECRITRQTFYYHFADIPDLMQWVLEQKSEQLLSAYAGPTDLESYLRYFLLISVNAQPAIKKGMAASGYGEEFSRLLLLHMQSSFEKLATENGAFLDCSPAQRKLIFRYHSLAVLGVLEQWSAEDSRNMDAIAHTIAGLIDGRIVPFPSEAAGAG